MMECWNIGIIVRFIATGLKREPVNEMFQAQEFNDYKTIITVWVSGSGVMQFWVNGKICV